MNHVAIPFSSPVTMAIFGCTLCGKTTWAKRLLENSDLMFDKRVNSILYCYGIYQSAFDEMESKLDNFELHAGIPSKLTITELSDKGGHTLIILDDLQQELCKDVVMEKLFTQLAHHLNISVIFMGNNLFQKDFSRTITVNTHVLILFRNSRDGQQIRCLSRQIYPKKSEEFINAYNDSTQKPWGYLVVDLSPTGYEQLRLRTNIFPGEDPLIYKL